MSDMSDAQRRAARAALNAYPEIQLRIDRGAGRALLTPTRGSSIEGAPVTVIYGATVPRQITQELQQSCSDLMEQV